MKGGNSNTDFIRKVPSGDNMERDVCNSCGFIHYENPTVVVGSVAKQGEKFLLCRRSINPRRGFWTLPAGFLELRETPENGALREAREEANADLTLHALLAVYTIPRLSQIQLIYRATLNNTPSAGEETLEVELFEWEWIPWDDIAFPSVRWALNHDRELGEGAHATPFINPPGEWGDLT